MLTARLIVCERTGYWAARLRRLTTVYGLAITETRSLADCWDELQRSPASVLALEVSPGGTAALAARLMELETAYPQAIAVLLASRQWRWLADELREAGARHVVSDLRGCGPLIRLVSRHLARAPQPDQSWREGVWARLPWDS